MGFLTDHCARMRRNLSTDPLDRAALQARADRVDAPRDFVGALRAAITPAVIAEVKRSSPSAGQIREAEPATQAAAYQASGASAISVLTEPEHFDGSLGYLQDVHPVVTLPVMRKDFLVHQDQILESRAYGADAALVIATILDADELARFLRRAEDMEMGTLVEAFGEDDLARAVASGAEVIGVNARDLESLKVDEDRALSLLERIPQDRIRVFESGIATREQVQRAVDAGADAVLVGTALMQAQDPGAKMRELLGAAP